jgi:hypothetical protein
MFTVAPGVDVDTVHVGLSAAAGPAFVHTSVPVTVCPGAIDAGNPLIADVISAVVSLTVIETIARSHAVETACEQIWYSTVYEPGGVPAGTTSRPVVGLIVADASVVFEPATMVGAKIPPIPMVGAEDAPPRRSLPITLTVPPATEPTLPLSLIASIIASTPPLVLLVVLPGVSLVAVVFPSTTTCVAGSSTPP